MRPNAPPNLCRPEVIWLDQAPGQSVGVAREIDTTQWRKYGFVFTLSEAILSWQLKPQPRPARVACHEPK